MKRFAIALLATTLFACAGGDPSNADPGTNNDNNTSSGNNNTGQCEDLDGDGFEGRGAGCNQGTDCDDRSAQVNPGAMEVCGDRRDNNCDQQIDEGCQANMDCTDADGDRYGTGPGCFGPDCDDTNPAINPGAMETMAQCGNMIDEDCSGADLECAANCIDADNDGYGAMGSTDCRDMNNQVVTEIDCDDTNAAINPSANEICDDKDNNCDGTVDECALTGQACTGPGGTCQGGAGSQCENADDCAGQFLTCDPSVSPKICKVAEGGPCSDTTDCVDGIFCENSVCTGNFCAGDPCNGNAPYDICDRAAGICVECPHFDPDVATQDAACENGQQCVPGGWCAYNDPIDAVSGLTLDITADEEYFWVNVWMADCWNFTRPDGEKKMCSAFFVASDAITLTENGAEDAYVGGHLDNELTMEENDALYDIWGEGFFNLKEIDWKADPQPGTAKEYCLWYQPGGLLSGESLVLDKCENFTP